MGEVGIKSSLLPLIVSTPHLIGPIFCSLISNDPKSGLRTRSESRIPASHWDLVEVPKSPGVRRESSPSPSAEFLQKVTISLEEVRYPASEIVSDWLLLAERHTTHYQASLSSSYYHELLGVFMRSGQISGLETKLLS